MSVYNIFSPRMSSHFFLVEYLNSAISSLKDLPHPVAASIRSLISDLQIGLHQNLSPEVLSEKLSHVSELLETLRQDFLSSSAHRSPLDQLNRCHLFLQEFKNTLSDKLSVESALALVESLKVLDASSGLSNSVANAVESVKKLKSEIFRQPIGPAIIDSFENAFFSVKALKEGLEKKARSSDGLEEALEAARRALEFLTVLKNRLLERAGSLEAAKMKLEEVKERVKSLKAEGSVALEVVLKKVEQLELKETLNMEVVLKRYAEAVEGLGSVQESLTASTSSKVIELHKKVEVIKDALVRVESYCD